MATPKEFSNDIHWHVFFNECSVPQIQFLQLNVAQLEVVHTFQSLVPFQRLRQVEKST